MLKIKKKDWENYINALAKVSDKAAKEIQDFIDKNGMENVTALIGKSYQCSVKYGEAAMALTCEMYDRIAVVQKAEVRPAVPARDVTLQEVKDTVNHAMRTAPSTVPAVTGKLVKKASSRTMRKNAARDGAKMALVPSSDGCPFCKMLGSRGWESARSGRSTSFEAHLHAHCRCEYVVDIKGGMQVEGYDPEALYDEFMNLDGTSWEERMNIMRNQQRKIPEIRDKINAQKREAYAARTNRGLAKASARFVNNQELLYRNSARVKKLPGYDDFVCHGTPYGFFINIDEKKEIIYEMTPKEYAARIRKSKDFHGKDIRILSCQTGLLDDGAAQQLANELGVRVLAPTETVNIDEDGRIFLSDNDILADMWYNATKEEKDKFVQTGRWRVFKPK